MQSLSASLKKRGKTIGFVPTMGYLHEGHLSLFRRARREHEVLAVSIFVNPSQFGPKEDFKRYPRDFHRDARLCRKEKVDLLFVPGVRAVYPEGFDTYVEPGRLASGLCGRSRPGHFRGVATVVAKLFSIVQPAAAYFGQKDYQQALIIQQMVRDLNLPIGVKICPTVRDRSGLALSSRNTYLDAEARRKALCLARALRSVRRKVRKGVRDVSILKKGVRNILKEGLSRIDYAEILNANDLSPVRRVSGKIVVTLAGFVAVGTRPGGRREVRLIDNCLIRVR